MPCGQCEGARCFTLLIITCVIILDADDTLAPAHAADIKRQLHTMSAQRQEAERIKQRDLRCLKKTTMMACMLLENNDSHDKHAYASKKE